MSTGRKFTTKTTLAKEKGWQLGMVDELMGEYDYVGRPPSQWMAGIPMYSLAVANLFDGAPEVQWRKMRKSARKINPSPDVLEQWRAGNITDQKEATRWCIQRAWAAHTNQALEVAKHLDHDHRDVFYGMSRKVLVDKELRRAIRELDLDGAALKRHMLRAVRTRRDDEALAIASSPAFRELNDPLYIKNCLDMKRFTTFRHFVKKFSWNEAHAPAVTEMIFSLIRIRRIDLLSKLPGQFFDRDKRSMLFATFIEKSPRGEAQENTEDMLKWARSVWPDQEIISTLTDVSRSLHGGGQKRNVVNFIKLFEKLAGELPGFDDKSITGIKKQLRKDVEGRDTTFRSEVLKVQLGEIVKHASTSTPSTPAAKPKM